MLSSAALRWSMLGLVSLGLTCIVTGVILGALQITAGAHDNATNSLVHSVMLIGLYIPLTVTYVLRTWPRMTFNSPSGSNQQSCATFFCCNCPVPDFVRFCSLDKSTRLRKNWNFNKRTKVNIGLHYSGVDAPPPVPRTVYEWYYTIGLQSLDCLLFKPILGILLGFSIVSV